MILVCAFAGLVVFVLTIAAFEHPKGRWPLALALFCLCGGVVAATFAGIMAHMLANWPDGTKTADQIQREVTGTVLLILLPCVMIGCLAMWKWIKQMSNKPSQPIAGKPGSG